MNTRSIVRRMLLVAVIALVFLGELGAAVKDGRYLYVVCPGIRNYLEFGGAGILVYDIDAGHKLVKRIATPASLEEKPDNIKGVCACAATQRLYFTTTKKLYCVDLLSEKTLWETEPVNGTDRMSITPDGKIIYVPSFEKDTWNVIDAKWGHLIPRLKRKAALITRWSVAMERGCIWAG